MAMIGSSAYAGAVTHTLSSAVLLLELTGDATYALHVMLATAISFSVARLLSPSIFERVIRLRGLPYVSDMPYLPHVVDAKSIMTDSVVPSLFLLLFISLFSSSNLIIILSPECSSTGDEPETHQGAAEGP